MNVDIFHKLSRSFRKHGALGLISNGVADLLEISSKRLVRLRDHHSKHSFIDRSQRKPNLVVILAGYKPYLWPATLARLAKYAPNDADFCVASAGMFSTELADICARNGWSYLSVKRNSPGIALNKAITLHPAADYIYKLDEDIVISSNFFSLLRVGYEHAWKTSLQEPGFCAPILNINGISYRAFLRELGLEAEYKKEFGQLFQRCDDLPVHNNPDACWWLWRNTLPFDDKAALFAKTINRYSVCSTRFSIGAILFRREFIEKVGGFKSAWHSGVLGVDEDMLCRDCVSQSRPMYIIESVLAGHFSFYPQESLMKEKLPEMSLLDPVTFPKNYYAAPE